MSLTPTTSSLNINNDFYSNSYDDTDWLCINTIRTLAIDAIQKANSGHPGMPMGCAPMAYVLWRDFLRHDPKDTSWLNRDRFVLSGGHGSMLLYALMHLHGYEDVPLSALKNFRQLGSKTPGHPEAFVTKGVEATTGPLGQGSANAAGMALAERKLANILNTQDTALVDHYTYALVTDGDIMEGLSAEVASLAAHLKLGRLIYLYDANEICLDGPISMTFSEDVGARYKAYGWHVEHITSGDTDLFGIRDALSRAKEDARPSIIIVNTTIGFGSPNKAGTSSAHGSPLGADEIALTKKELKWPSDEAFHIPASVEARFSSIVDYKQSEAILWREQFGDASAAKKWQSAVDGDLPEGWDADLPIFTASDNAEASRVSSGKIINALASKLPFFFGGDADLSCSTKTAIKEGGSFSGSDGSGRNIHYGVREHAMAAMASGIAYHQGLINYTATFFCFADYMRPAIRLAAMNKLPVIYVFTHDSVALGEDGPTHQPIEHLMSLRIIPNLHVLRPADANETREAWRHAIQRQDGPCALILSRQNLPIIDREKHLRDATGLHRGAFTLCTQNKANKADIILAATGSEVHLALAAAKELEAENIAANVVSMPCWALFDAQGDDYRRQVFPAETPVLAIEAGIGLGWERYVHYTDRIISIDRYGASAPASDLAEYFGLTTKTVLDRAKALLSK